MENPKPEKKPSAERDKGSDDRSPMAKAMDIVSRITTISLMAALPALGGYYLDLNLGTGMLFLLLGFAFGFCSAGWQLWKLVRMLESRAS